MSHNRFGRYYTFTSFGESHGQAIGGVIDGCPAGLKLDLPMIQAALDARKPGKTYTSLRAEDDKIEFLSGLYEGQTTGAPLAFVIHNRDADRTAYQEAAKAYRPGHANYTYIKKYGVFDPYGGGRASARETAIRVVAGALAKQILAQQGIFLLAYLSQVGNIKIHSSPAVYDPTLQQLRDASPVFTIDTHLEQAMKAEIEAVQQEHDSVGGVVEVITSALPVGLGDPVYDKLEAWLGYAMLSIPGTKGFSLGLGFDGVAARGSAYHDPMGIRDGKETFMTNHAGGTLGGISNGMPLVFQVAFKPTSSIQKPIETLTLDGKPHTFSHPAHARHDPCIAIRGVIVVEAMTACVLVDAWLADRLTRMK
jgi:chorismate synthase